MSTTMTKYRIRHRWEDRTLYEGEHGSLREAVLAAVAGGANLSRAYLSDAYLSDADLSDANLSRAYLSDADLSDANLSRANLSGIRDDLYAVLAAAPREVPGLLAALKAGRINGTVYQGECACLVGTIANLRHCDYRSIPELYPDSTRPAERWFLAIMPGNTPENHPVAKITAEWILAWLEANPQPVAEVANA